MTEEEIPPPPPEEENDIDVIVEPAQPKARVFNFIDVEEQFRANYWPTSRNNSAILDLIALYLKGQRILYTEAKTLCEQRLTYLMLPAIFNTALASILSLVLQSTIYGPIIVSCLNGVNSFFLALINYLKLDARAESHRNSAYKFDKLQVKTVFNSGKALFNGIDEDSDDEKDINIKTQRNVLKLISQIEKEVNEIKDTNQFVLPELIRIKFPIVYGSNIFSKVKSIMSKETTMINNLKDILNDRETARAALINSTETERELSQKKYDEIVSLYRDQVSQLIGYIHEYDELDREIERELYDNNYYKQKGRFFHFCSCLKN